MQIMQKNIIFDVIEFAMRAKTLMEVLKLN